MVPSEHSKNIPMDQLDRIFSILRHEFGNSVNSLKVTLEVLCNSFSLLDDGKKLDLLHLAREQVAKQHNFLNGLRAYTRTAAGDLTAISIDPFWSEYMQMVSSRLAARNIRFNQSAPMENCVVTGNRAALQRLLDLLVDNAVDAVEDAEKPAIAISSFTSDRFVDIIIQDNGEGGVSENQHKIFLPFFSTRKDRLGLGLPMACKLLEGMGGDLKISSRATGGSKARVRLLLKGEAL
ncbi:MAG: hypothetical protein B6I22_03335 [Desulfobacteraceae bacterium 4572_123]|nr:MAG: hypothetical protein B6I22_03335 [Desulfobacteraceae bacterium 4572_123]